MTIRSVLPKEKGKQVNDVPDETSMGLRRTLLSPVMSNTHRRSPSQASRKPADQGGLRVPPRGLSRMEAAAYAGVSPSAFSLARREGKYPNPTLPGGRYDRPLLDQAMDRLSGIVSKSDVMSPLDSWRGSRDPRSPQGH